jgi:hypothetical protein
MTTAQFLSLMIMPLGGLAIGGLVYWVATRSQ